MAKVVQFLEIGNLPKSQLNACPYRKVMIKNLFLSISKSGSARNFHTIFEFSLQISRSHGPPVLWLSLMSSLAPLESSFYTLSNGSRLDISGARGSIVQPLFFLENHEKS